MRFLDSSLISHMGVWQLKQINIMSWDDDWDDDDACPCDACVYNEGDYCHWGHDDWFNDCEVCIDFDDGELDEDDDYEDEDDQDMREGEDDLLDYYNNH